MGSGFVFLMSILALAAVGSGAEAETARSYPVGRGGRLFGDPDVIELLARPYEDHVPMACSGACLWAAHPEGWAFRSGVSYYLLNAPVGFDVEIDDGSAPAEPYSAVFYPSHVALRGGAGDLDIAGAKWITADDVLVARFAVSNRSGAEARLDFRLTLPASSPAVEDDRLSWSFDRSFGRVYLMGRAPGFALEPDGAEAAPGCWVEGEAPAAQRGSQGPDAKTAASGGAVLGSGFGGHEGDYAEWTLEVSEAIEDGMLVFRYARATAGAAEFKVMVPGLGFVERHGFQSTGGWGDAPDHLQAARLKLGRVPQGAQTVRIVAVANGANVNIDTVGIAPQGAVLPGSIAPATRLKREIRLGPGQSAQVSVCLAASTRPADAAAALARVCGLDDPLRDQRESYVNWVTDNVPVFASSEELTKQYWHRATSILKKNLFRFGEGRLADWGIAEGRWNSTWYPNMISYGAGHQIREARWLREPQYVRGIISTWCANPKDDGVFPNYIQPDHIGKGQYTDWIPAAAWDAWCVAPDPALLRQWVGPLARNVDGWLAVYDPDQDGLLLVDSHWWTGMEWQPSFFYFKDFDKDRQDQQLERVDLTAYVYGDAAAVARMFEQLGDEAGRARYAETAARIRDALTRVMWDEETQFFYSVEPVSHAKARVKEIVGVYPFYFSMLPADTAYAEAWRSILDPAEFWTAWPLASATKKCPAYSQDESFHGKQVGGCMWNGPSWPHANSLALSAMGATLRTWDHPPLTADHFVSLLKSYAVAQFLNQDIAFPWTGEYYTGDTGAWRTGERDYNHSTYLDVVIGDLAGLRPRPDAVLEVQPLLAAGTPWFLVDGVRYHGHDVTLAWNAPGSGTPAPDGLDGFRVYVDGRLAHRAADAPGGKLSIELPLE